MTAHDDPRPLSMRCPQCADANAQRDSQFGAPNDFTDASAHAASLRSAFEAGALQAQLEDAQRREVVYLDALRLAGTLLETAAEMFAGQHVQYDLFDARLSETSRAIKSALMQAPRGEE